MFKKWSARGSASGQVGVTRRLARGSARSQVGVSHSVYSVRDVFEWSNSVQIWVEKGAGCFKTMFKKWSARGQLGITRGSARGQPRFTRGQPGITRGSARGQVGVSQGSARGQSEVIGMFLYDPIVVERKVG